MNAESITGWLTAIGVPDEVVSVGSEADNTWCLLRTEQVMPAADAGASDGGVAAGARGDESADTVVVAWEVFWREQGNRYDWASFTNEQVACHYLFGRLAWSQVVRGAVGLLPGGCPSPTTGQ